MTKFMAIAALGFALTTAATGPARSTEAAPAAPQRCPGVVFRGQAEWVTTPSGSCGPFSAVLVQSTQADINVVEFIYQFGDSCLNTFGSVSGSGLVKVVGNLHALRIDGSVPLSDGRTVDIDIHLKSTSNVDNGGVNQTVSATARGSVTLGGVDLTGDLPTTVDTQISRTAC